MNMASSGSYTGDVASVDGKVLPLFRVDDTFLLEDAANGDVYHMVVVREGNITGLKHKNVYPGKGRCGIHPAVMAAAYDAMAAVYSSATVAETPPDVPAPVCACCNGTKVTKSLFLGVDMPCPECKEK